MKRAPSPPVCKGLALVRRLLVVALSLAVWQPAIGADDAARPAQKDSPARAKPRDAELTAAVVPAEARPGETVRFQVTARLKPGWHIYTQARKQEGEGPRKTIFDLFDLSGLEVAGDWKASREPESKAEPAFDNQVFSFFSEEVTWSIPIKVPTTATPGKKAIHCQASYQICNAQSCSFPGRWTLPEATLNVIAGGGDGSQNEQRHEVQRPQSAAAAPAAKDSPPRLRPKGVTLTPSVSIAEVQPGGSVTYKVTAKLDPGLHIYAYAKKKSDQPGPIPTTFDFFDPADFKIQGDWKADREPVARPEPAFDNQVVEFFENEVAWTITIQVPADAGPGKRTLRCQAGYQVCTAKFCYPEVHWTLPAVVLNVVAGQANAPAAAVAATPAPAPPQALADTGPARDPQPSQPAPAQPAADPSSGSTSESRTSAAAASKPVSEIARRAQEGLIPFLITCVFGGLLALAMPCVWPMIPITVNFFLKQGQASGKGKATGLALTYCLAIIAIFTLVGVFFSFFFSASSLQNLANNPWLNLGVAAIFFAFGLSLLGLFEIRLPSSLLNASARGENRGGLIGVIFMALTLTITSFTCTFPVVGGLLVMAAGGNFLYPILGLATFAAVLAFPFFLLALSPGLLAKMPRSGDWMNTVKVVGGLVEIGAAFKFLNTAELGYVTPENAWFDAHVVLTAWIVLSAVCGLYLLGLFRTDHDHDAIKVGPGRMIFGALFLGMALYMAPALFGRPPQSLVWDRLIVGILPPDSSEFAPEAIAGLGPAAEGGASGPTEVRASSTDPAQAEREEKKFHGVLWGMSLDQAKELAAAQKKPILIDFTGVNCANCRTMEKYVLRRPEVVDRLKQFVTVQLYTDFVWINSLSVAQRKALAERNQEIQLDLTQEMTNPFYVVLTPDGKLVASLGGLTEPQVFVDFLTKALEKARGEVSVAQIPSD
ncbi:MAG: protein-disulfide reductase DsbD family protein [Isosphaeraceae bacterium]